MLKRLALILVIVLLPIQMTWATAGAYCQHEQGAAARHFGHHDHRHKEGKPGSKVAAGVDADCFNCHLGSANFPAAPTSLVAPTASLLISLSSLPSLPSSVPDQPERPKWTLIA